MQTTCFLSSRVNQKQNKTIESITRNEPSLHDIFVKIAGKSIDESGDVKNEK